MKIIDGDEIKGITPEIVAELFVGMISYEQARFFNRVGEVVATWGGGGGFYMQLQYVSDEPVLARAGRRVMQDIGDYAAVIRTNDRIESMQINVNELRALKAAAENYAAEREVSDELVAALKVLTYRNVTYWSENGEAKSNFGSSQKAIEAFSNARAALAKVASIRAKETKC